MGIQRLSNSKDVGLYGSDGKKLKPVFDSANILQKNPVEWIYNHPSALDFGYVQSLGVPISKVDIKGDLYIRTRTSIIKLDKNGIFQWEVTGLSTNVFIMEIVNNRIFTTIGLNGSSEFALVAINTETGQIVKSKYLYNSKTTRVFAIAWNEVMQKIIVYGNDPSANYFFSFYSYDDTNGFTLSKSLSTPSFFFNRWNDDF